MPTSDYLRVDRVMRVARRLRERKPFNAETLAEEFGATARTIKRDIEFLRQRGWVIEWIHDEHTYNLKRAPRAIL